MATKLVHVALIEWQMIYSDRTKRSWVRDEHAPNREEHATQFATREAAKEHCADILVRYEQDSNVRRADYRPPAPRARLKKKISRGPKKNRLRGPRAAIRLPEWRNDAPHERTNEDAMNSIENITAPAAIETAAIEIPAPARVLPKRVVERLSKARAAGRSFRDIEGSMAKTLGVKACNGTAAMRLCRIAGIK